jgi:hypothetical protein
VVQTTSPSESVTRLALGIEPTDPLLRAPVPRPLAVGLDRAGTRRGSVDRRTGGRFAVLFTGAVESPVDVRIVDPLRHYVPRRISFPIDELAAVLAAEAADDDVPAARRTRTPALFPGAAYDVRATTTGLRGRVTRGGRPLRWARVVATIAGGGHVVGRAHGDDRGEFLMPLAGDPDEIGTLTLTFEIDVTVHAPDPAPAPGASDDPLWDLPVEVATAPGTPDAVSAGLVLPPSYTASAARTVALPVGQVTSLRQPFLIP